MKKINILKSLIGLPIIGASLVPVFTVTSCSNTKIGVDSTTVKVHKHKAIFTYSYKGKFEVYMPTVSGYDDKVLSVSRRSTNPYEIEMGVLVQPNNQTYPLTIKFHLYDATYDQHHYVEQTVYVNNAIDETSFEDDSWEHIISIANDTGRAGLEAQYGDTFAIGAERGVIVNTLPHTVRLIGVEQDTYGDGNKTATLTFEFANVITYGTNNAFAWNDNNYNYADESSTNSLFYKLKDNNGTITKLLPDYLLVDGAIKMTDRKILTDTSTEWSNPTVTSYQAKLFLPCLSDMFSEIGIQSMSTSDPFGSNKNLYKKELSKCRQYEEGTTRPTQYYYYQSILANNKPGSQDESTQYKILDKCTVGQNSSTKGYWIGTPLLYPGSTSASYANRTWCNGSLCFGAAKSTSDRLYGIAPLFCI